MRRSMSCGAYTLSIDRPGICALVGSDYSGARRRGGFSRAAARAAAGRSVHDGGGGRGCGRGVSARRALDQKVREQRCRPPAAAFLCTAVVSGARDVEMRPFESLGELAEKGGRGDRAAVAPADVGEVGEVALELLSVLLGERQLPAASDRAHSVLQELAHQSLIVAHDARVVVTEGDHAGAGERGDVDDRGRMKAPRIV